MGKPITQLTCLAGPSGRKNILRKLLRISYRRLKAGFFCVLTVFDCAFCWLRLNEMHKVWTFASRKAFLPLCGFCSSSLENYFGLRTTDVKAKTDHSVSLRWNKKFWAFPKRRVLFWLCIRFICELISLSFAGRKNPLVFRLLSKYFFTCPDLFPLQNQLYPSLQSKNHLCAIKLSPK